MDQSNRANLEKLRYIFNSHHTIREIVQDRGYDVSDIPYYELWEDFLNFAEGKKESVIKEELGYLVENKGKKLLVFWYKDPKLDTGFTNIYSEKIEKPGIQNVIIVVDVGVTSYTKGIIRALAKGKLHTSKESLGKKKEKVRVDTYTLEEAQYNISKNELVPKHIVCTNSEKNRILSQYDIKKGKCPRIPYIDPMSRHLGLSKGTMVKIIGESSTEKEEEVILNYRICS